MSNYIVVAKFDNNLNTKIKYWAKFTKDFTT